MQLSLPQFAVPSLAYLSCYLIQWQCATVQCATAEPPSNEPGKCPSPSIAWRIMDPDIKGLSQADLQALSGCYTELQNSFKLQFKNAFCH